MSVTAPQGFEAAGVVAGLKSTGKPDVALVVNRGPRKVGVAVFTSNRAKANPIIWSQEVVKDGIVEAVVLNSGGANCFTGPFGFQTSHLTAERAGELLGVSAGDVVVCSTGLIGTGDEVFRGKVLAGVEAGVAQLSADGGQAAAEAIMTTDTVAKTVAVTRDGWTIGGMAKGAGMLARGSPRCSWCSRPTPCSMRPRPTRCCAARPAPPSTGSTRTDACRPTTR